MAGIKLAPLCAAVAITASGVFLIASPSSAKERPVVVEGAQISESVVQRVSYADLDLAAQSDTELLYRRVGRAVREVCRAANPGASFPEMWMCKDMSWEAARPQIAGVLKRAHELASLGRPTKLAGAVQISAQ